MRYDQVNGESEIERVVDLPGDVFLRPEERKRVSDLVRQKTDKPAGVDERVGVMEIRNDAQLFDTLRTMAELGAKRNCPTWGTANG